MLNVTPNQRVQDAPDWQQSTFANGDIPKWDSASGTYKSAGGGGGVTSDNHKSARAATVAAGTLATSFANGQVIDGVTLVTNDRILIQNQASAVENGLYTVNASGAPTRATDLPAAANAAFFFVFVREGTANADKGFLCTSLPGADVVGTNNLTFVQFTGGAGTLHSSLSGLSADDHPQYLLAAGTRALTGDMSCGTHKLTNLATPTNAADACTKAYADGLASGLKIKPTVRVATTAAQTLATDFANGQTIDGVVLSTGDRVLIKNQSSGVENGIYTVNASGAPTRASDMAAASNAAAAFTFVTQGTTQAGEGWVCTNAAGSDVVGTNALTFTQFNGAAGGGGGGGGSGTLTGLESRARPFRNWLVNGGFGQFQRRVGVSSISMANSVYGPDSWYALTQTAAVTVLQLSGTSKYSAQITQPQATAQRFGLAQVLDAADTAPLRSRSVTLQGRVNASNNQAIRFAILEWQGTADSPVRDVVNSWTNGTFTTANFFKAANMAVVAVGSITPAASTWTDFSLTGTPSSVVNNLIVFVWTEGTAATSFTLELEKFILSDGPVVRDWLPEPETINRRRCERFLRTVSSATGICDGTSQVRMYIPYPGMIAQPTFSVTGALSFDVGTPSGFANVTQSSANVVGAISGDSNGASVDFGNLAGLTTGWPAALVSNPTARVLLDASL